MKNSDAVQFIDRLKKEIDICNYQLNPYEQRFLPSVERWVRSGGDLSDKQTKVLQKIYQRVTDVKSLRGGNFRI